MRMEITDQDKKEAQEAYEAALKKHEEYKQTWDAFEQNAEGLRQREIFEDTADYKPSFRARTPGYRAFKDLERIWLANGKWTNREGELAHKKTISRPLTGRNGRSSWSLAALSGSPWPEAESVIAEDPWWSYEYALEIVGSGHELIEQTIATSGHYAYLYARFVVKGRFAPGEDAISKDPQASSLYAQKVLEERFVPGEPGILLTEVDKETPISLQNIATEYRQWCIKIGSPLEHTSNTVMAGEQA